MFFKCMLLVSAFIIFFNNSFGYEQRTYRDFVRELVERYRHNRRDNYVNENDFVDRTSNVVGDYRKENLFNRLADYTLKAKQRENDWFPKSNMPLPVHEDESQSEDGIIDENLVDTEESEEFCNEAVHPKPVTETRAVKMPNVSPKQMDTYFCVSHKLPEEDGYIVEFTPIAKMQVAHHMLLFSCEEPFKEKGWWNCREMQPVCSSGQQSIMYAWAKNAPSLKMPKDVGFHTGGKSAVKYLVLQVHYLHIDVFKNGATDQSGLTFEWTKQRQRFLAGIYVLAAGGPPILPHQKKFHMDMGCDYSTNYQPGAIKISPFRFRTHAHKLGAVITGYRVRDGKWTIIGRGDPQRPQAFYKVFNDVDIQQGDKVMGRCTYNSMSRNRTTYIGATHKDEMCNFYIMYFYDSCKYDHLNTPCEFVDPASMKYPADSDVTLAATIAQNKKNADKIKKELHNSLYTQVHEWPINGMTDGDLALTIGQIAGVDVDNDNDMVVLFHRGERVWGANTFDFHNVLRNKTTIRRSPLIWLDRHTGDIEKAGGARMFCIPHGITIDHNGNIWVTDVGTHQVFKLSPEVKVLLALGERFVPGNDFKHFCKPTDVAVMKDGHFFVSDGYCNSRVLKFNKAGNVIMEIKPETFAGTVGFPKPHFMNVVHSLALDEGHNRLFVADRENERVLVFHPNTGHFITAIAKKFHGAVYAVAYSNHDGGVLHVVNGPSGYSKVTVSGFTYSLSSETVKSKWRPKQGFHLPHDLAVTDDNTDIFVAEIGPNKIWKFEKNNTRSNRP